LDVRDDAPRLVVLEDIHLVHQVRQGVHDPFLKRISAWWSGSVPLLICGEGDSPIEGCSIVNSINKRVSLTG